MLNLSNHLAITKSSSVEHIQDEQHTADLSKVITMDSKVRFEVANSNIWLNHLATTTIIQVLDLSLTPLDAAPGPDFNTTAGGLAADFFATLVLALPLSDALPPLLLCELGGWAGSGGF